MIKKIVLLCAVLMITVVPCVFADAGPPPKEAKEQMVEIDIKLLNDDVKIGDYITVEITLTNITNKQIRCESFNISILKFQSTDTTWSGEDYNIIKPHETVVYTASGILYEDIDFYKDGDSYYTDIGLYVELYLKNEGGYYQRYVDSEPVEIINLYDGNEYIEYEWLDDRETMYIYDTYYHDYSKWGEKKLYGSGGVHYKLRLKNNSSVIVGLWRYGEEIYPGKERILYSQISCEEFLLEENADTYVMELDKVFFMNDKYYHFVIQRIYNLEMLYPPQVSMKIDSYEDPDDDKTMIYNIEVVNNTDEKIEDFYMSLAPDYKPSTPDAWICDLGANETASHEFYVYGRYSIDELIIGEIVDGMCFMYSIDNISSYTEYSELTEVVYSIYGIYAHYDYDYAMERKAQRENVEPSAEPVETAVQTPIYTPNTTAQPQPTSKVTVTKRRSPYLLALIVIGVLICGAVAVIVLSMKKIIKNRQNEEKDD